MVVAVEYTNPRSSSSSRSRMVPEEGAENERRRFA